MLSSKPWKSVDHQNREPPKLIEEWFLPPYSFVNRIPNQCILNHAEHVCAHICAHTCHVLVSEYEDEWNFMLMKSVFYDHSDDFNYLCIVKFTILMFILKQKFCK